MRNPSKVSPVWNLVGDLGVGGGTGFGTPGPRRDWTDVVVEPRLQCVLVRREDRRET